VVFDTPHQYHPVSEITVAQLAYLTQYVLELHADVAHFGIKFHRVGTAFASDT
jgi:hypothetical protein